MGPPLPDKVSRALHRPLAHNPANQLHGGAKCKYESLGDRDFIHHRIFHRLSTWQGAASQPFAIRTCCPRLHSSTHRIRTAARRSVRQWLWDSDQPDVGVMRKPPTVIETIDHVVFESHCGDKPRHRNDHRCKRTIPTMCFSSLIASQQRPVQRRRRERHPNLSYKRRDRL